MKKLFFVAVAAFALTFASCGNKTAQPVEEVDSVALLTEEATVAADSMVSDLTKFLDAKDVNAFQAALETVKEKIAELAGINPDVAKEYMTKIQNFLNEKKDVVAAVVGSNAAVSEVVKSLVDNPVDKFVDSVKESLTGAKDAAVDKAAEAVDGAKEAVDGAKEAVDGAVDAVKEAPAKAVDAAKEQGGKAIDNAAAGAKKALGL